eukprot:CAMPEP_0114660688 /NCGR_PEP_ID=MMETSP0191-20121206/20668_1 /TAXON_ID=126664 /ORGANISM="Sorites sp." /LENGTH=77 /DNA_ID=CAMNT_0001890301 /DNA_START=1025 /DNA_END=1258 /DNA_ORIENTATION=-
MTFNNNTYWSIINENNITFPDNYNITTWQSEGKDINVALKDPMFNDPQSFDFTLNPDSPSIALGFKQIDTTNIGPNW